MGIETRCYRLILHNYLRVFSYAYDFIDRLRALNVELDVAYHAPEDRIRLLIRRADQPSEWWLTRRTTLRLLDGWVQRLESVPLPRITPAPEAPWMPPPVRELGQQHAVLMELDAPRARMEACASLGSPARLGGLVSTVKLTVSASSCSLRLVAQAQQVDLTLTRKDAHALLEALACAVNRSGWLAGHVLPEWLGQGGLEGEQTLA